ncbi:FAD-dependent oxidoreductase [Formicincola oecophyllae]|uniref:FAD-dependent oxidoreductase n=1 Tax=Formicincola oecophyllae TaxID=2558361 RepID=A0A4Y6UBW4_9PROT|nr:hydroxysqualene dehydroxylase HpnE [Formicincola oecophyllae]QDH13957.1 FAD-dependent oxidoreductase [Formicincola oecophyllae]
MNHVHIIGGGLAGLAAAVELAPQARVTLYEAAPHCGGRVRSFHTRSLDTVIDNGNHLILSANHLTFRYLDTLDSRHTLKGPGQPLFPWYDLADGTAWTLNLSKGRVPWWLLNPRRRVPGMKMAEIASLGRILRAGPEKTVAECLLPGEFSRRLLVPLALSALNTDVESASAELFAAIIKRTLMKGGQSCCPWTAAHGLSDTFINPAVAFIERFGGAVRTRCRVAGLERAHGRVTKLETVSGPVEIGPDDSVIVALPATQTLHLLPEIPAPDGFEAILNAHYAVPGGVRTRGVVKKAGFIGMVGGIADWVFIHDRILSVTVSGANRFMEDDSETLLAHIWSDIRQALKPAVEQPLPLTMPEGRLVREKKATFAATPLQAGQRAGAAGPCLNLALAGAWTDTGLPSTIEGAIQSGLAAVAALGYRSAWD